MLSWIELNLLLQYRNKSIKRQALNRQAPVLLLRHEVHHPVYGVSFARTHGYKYQYRVERTYTNVTRNAGWLSFDGWLSGWLSG